MPRREEPHKLTTEDLRRAFEAIRNGTIKKAVFKIQRMPDEDDETVQEAIYQGMLDLRLPASQPGDTDEDRDLILAEFLAKLGLSLPR